MPNTVFEPKWKLTPNKINDSNSDGFGLNHDNLVPDRMSTTESPKYNFNFTVEFFYSGKLNATPHNLTEDNKQNPSQNWFAVTKVTRPQPTINYQKVNFYNFRTNVATSMDYGTVTISFYDDAKNRAFDIFMQYLKAVSPIANVSHELANTLDVKGQYVAGEIHSASIGPLDMPAMGTTANGTTPLGGSNRPETTRRHGLIKRLRLNHFYKLDGDQYVIHYDYLNPKIVTAALSDVDMTQNGVTMVDMTFNYDSVYMSKETILTRINVINA